jgi:hypothetical protein
MMDFSSLTNPMNPYLYLDQAPRKTQAEVRQPEYLQAKAPESMSATEVVFWIGLFMLVAVFSYFAFRQS